MTRRAMKGTHLRIRGHLLRTMSRLQQRTFLLGLVVAGVGGLIALVAALSVNGVPFQNRYEFQVVIPGSTPPLKSGDQVRVAGKVAGIVMDVEPRRDTLRVAAELDPHYAPIGRGARVHVGVLLGTSLAYLVLDPGDARRPLPEGSTIPATRVSLSSSLPQALEAFDRSTRVALARNFEVLGEGSLGRGQQTNAALHDFRVVGEDGIPLVDALTPRPGTLRGLVRSLRDTTRGLRGKRADDPAAATRSVRQVLETLADRSRRTGALVERLAGVQDELLDTLPLADDALAKTAVLFRGLLPGTQAIAQQIPDFVGLFSEGPRLSAGTQRFGRAVRPTLAELGRALPLLRVPAAAVSETLDPLRRFGATIDAYERELGVLSDGFYDSFNHTFLGEPAWRVSGSLFCHARRNPYPQPGQSFTDRGGC